MPLLLTGSQTASRHRHAGPSRALALLAVAGLFAGCGAGDVTPEVLLGGGEYLWQDLVDGDPIDVVYGPQGGYHLLGSVRVRGLDPGVFGDLAAPTNPTTAFEVLVDGASYIKSATYVQGLPEATPEARDAGWTHEMIGRFVILEITDDAELDGVDLTLSVTVTAHDGAVATDARELVGVPHPAND